MLILLHDSLAEELPTAEEELHMPHCEACATLLQQ